MTATAGPIDVGELIDGGRWGGYQRWLVFLTALTIVFDGIDNQLMGVTIPTIMREWSVARSAFAPVVSLGYLGMVTGGALAGLLGDRIGRRVTLIASMIVFGGMTLAVAGAGSVARSLSCAFSPGSAWVARSRTPRRWPPEYVPRAQRPMAVTITIVCVPLGATLAGLAAIPALPAFGWRAMFLVGGLIPLVALRRSSACCRSRRASSRAIRNAAASLPHRSVRMGHPVADAATFVDRTDAAARGAR
jgi:AAHS family 4-hydroxybenzoate transporter-like MFS transporter